MELVIPEGAEVHITIGRAPLLALPGATPVDAAPAQPPVSRPRPVLKAIAGFVLLIAAFEGGRYVAARPTATEPAQAAFVIPAPAPVGSEHAFPDRPLPQTAAAQQPSQIPPAFREQLAQTPRVTPAPGSQPAPDSQPVSGESAPGQPAASADGATANPFGLHE